MASFGPLIVIFIVGAILIAINDDEWHLRPETRAYYPRHFDAKHIRYNTTMQNIRTQVDIQSIIAEKNKEPMYILKLVDIGLTQELPQSMYDKYIGEGNNAITCVCSQIIMYVATARGNNIFDTCKAYSVTRYILPWDTGKTLFLPCEVRTFYDTLCENKAYFDFAMLPFQFDLHNRSLESLSAENAQTYSNFEKEPKES